MLDRTIPRFLTSRLNKRLRQFPAVALLGPRQVGKTTLAQTFAETGAGSAPGSTETGLYLDLESPVDQEKLADARGYLGTKRGRRPTRVAPHHSCERQGASASSARSG